MGKQKGFVAKRPEARRTGKDKNLHRSQLKKEITFFFFSQIRKIASHRADLEMQSIKKRNNIFPFFHKFVRSHHIGRTSK